MSKALVALVLIATVEELQSGMYADYYQDLIQAFVVEKLSPELRA